MGRRRAHAVLLHSHCRPARHHSGRNRPGRRARQRGVVHVSRRRHSLDCWHHHPEQLPERLCVLEEWEHQQSPWGCLHIQHQGCNPCWLQPGCHKERHDPHSAVVKTASNWLRPRALAFCRSGCLPNQCCIIDALRFFSVAGLLPGWTWTRIPCAATSAAGL